MPRIYLSPPHMSAVGYEQSYVADAIASGWISPYGSYVDRLEQELAVLAERSGAAALSSGTAAIHMALRACGVQPGDRVVCSALTFAASCNPIIYEQGIPVFIDAAYSDWNMDADLLEQALADAARLGQPVKAVIAVSLYGNAADLQRISEICERYEVSLIDEAAEALGASVASSVAEQPAKPCGGFGRFGIYSFNGNKIITTSGGGAVLTDDAAALAKIRFWSTQSRDPAPHYEHSELGFNYRLSNICAAIGCGQLMVLSERLQQRREIFLRYQAAFAEVADIEMMPYAAGSNHWLSVITLKDGCRSTPADIAAALAAAGIETRPVWKPMQLQPFWRDYTFYSKVEGSVGADLFRRGICLPSGSALSPAEQQEIIDIVCECVR